MMRWQVPLGVAVIGLLVFAAGLLYGSFMVGVPYQEPTPAQSAAEKLHLAISGWGMIFGLGVLLVGTLMLLATFVIRRCTRRT